MSLALHITFTALIGCVVLLTGACVFLGLAYLKLAERVKWLENRR